MSMFGTPRKSKSQMVAALPGHTAARLVANNTLEWFGADGARRIRLHETDVLTFHPNGALTIDTGGWNTHTTRARLREFLPRGFNVWTHRGELTLSHPKGETRFRESCYIGPRGAVKPDMTPRALDSDRRLLDAFMRHVRKTGLPSIEESGGDPWVFSPGQVTPDVMRDWLESRYFTRRFCQLALAHAGLTETGQWLFMHDADQRGGKLDATTLRRIRRYARKCLGMEN